MSNYYTVTEEVLISLRKLAEQQNEPRALKFKNRILKQTYDVKLSESLSPISKKLDEVKESTQKLGDVIKENKTPQLAIENTHSALPIENEKIQPVVMYDTSLENTLYNMKKNWFFKIKERDNGDIFRNGLPIEKKCGNKPKVNREIYDITPGIQKF